MILSTGHGRVVEILMRKLAYVSMDLSLKGPFGHTCRCRKVCPFDQEQQASQCRHTLLGQQ